MVGNKKKRAHALFFYTYNPACLITSKTCSVTSCSSFKNTTSVLLITKSTSVLNVHSFMNFDKSPNYKSESDKISI